MADITELIIITTLIFLIAPAFLVLYIFIYNKRKKRHIEEKQLMQLTFESELIRTQMEIREQTMQTIGADLHDNIGQLLSLASQTLGSVNLDDRDKAQQKIDSVLDLTKQSIKELRLLGKLLEGEQLIALGLPEAIRQVINWIEKSEQCIVTYTIEGEHPAQNNPDKDLILFRILQEVFNNIIKHSKANEINIKLGYIQDGIRLQVIDNGTGFDIANMPENQKGMGLSNIQKRAEIVGGRFFIQSQPGEGTCIEIFIPYP
ncbi:MAG: sensor histidine kinase [Bacteroidetes bacterium]|jgi:signal transduction histidine kinase|nr:sensor histidine kinase [Bacteroidota bacterium]